MTDIINKFNGKCVICGRSIDNGSPVSFGKGGLRHRKCGGTGGHIKKAAKQGKRHKCRNCGARLQNTDGALWCPDCGWEE